MKQELDAEAAWLEDVASRAEAWIETQRARPGNGDCKVASRAEAWIETRKYLTGRMNKPHVASRAEAWIETKKAN